MTIPYLPGALAFALFATSAPHDGLGDATIHAAIVRWLLSERTPPKAVFIAMGPEWLDPSPELLKALRRSGVKATPFSQLRTSAARPLAAQGLIIRLGKVERLASDQVRAGYDVMTRLRVIDGASWAILHFTPNGWQVTDTHSVIF